jgi:hypothetical protein
VRAKAFFIEWPRKQASTVAKLCIVLYIRKAHDGK